MAKDPYRYFRIEAQELVEGLSQGLLALEKRPDPELVRRLLRLAHTFKGAARVVRRPDIGDLAHRIEDGLEPHRETGGPVEQATIDEAFAIVDEIRARLVELGTATKADAKAETKPAREPVEDREPAIRIPIAELDALLESVAEAHSAAASLRRGAAELAETCAQARTLLRQLGDGAGRRATPTERVADDLEQARRAIVERTERVLAEVDELRVIASDLRLVPASTLLADLERAARDAARASGKEVELHCRGGDTHLDAHVLSVLRKALVHVIRNSVAHGIEPPSVRRRVGKPTTGRIEIEIERRGHRVSIVCSDDGAGLDLDAVRRSAVARGVVDEATAATMDEAALGNLLLRGGVSTTHVVTDLAGRGVGLDAVRDAVQALDGEVVVHTTTGAGVSIDLRVPISLSAMPALPLYVEGAEVLVPLDSVRQAVRVAGRAITRDADGERLVVDGQVIPFAPLARMLSRPGHANESMQSAVVIEAEGRRAAIGVDRLGGARNIVVRAIPEHAAADPVVAGATFDDDGVPLLVLAPAVLVRAAVDARPHVVAAQPRKPAPILVIDDSLTTRMLEQSILESAGYEVDLAVSGEEALAMARERAYGLFLVDVEMPGMSGFEFIETARRDPALQHTPAILVTSRGDAEDKRRGLEAGARAYIVKGEFDQQVLLDTVRRLVR